jgi:tRNA modification GTPase
LELESLVCYEIDFPEEDSGPVPAERIDRAIRELTTSLANLVNTAPEGERVRDGALCVVAGRPNAGKSSLFNALLGVERAIVTSIPGTTRDAIEAAAVCDGYPFRLIDTAGLREGGETVERLGIEVSHRYLAAADVVLFCVESGRPIADEEVRFVRDLACPVILVRTKADRLGEDDRAKAADGELFVSAMSGIGMPELKQRLAQSAFSARASADVIEPLVTRERHRVALESALAEVAGFSRARARGVEVAVAASHLRAAVSSLEDIVGVVSTEDVLDRVFGSFCIGK